MYLTEEQDLESTVRNAPIGICILNAETFIIELVNTKFLEVTGNSYEAVLGHIYWETFAGAKDPYEQLLFNVVRTGEAFQADEIPLVFNRQGHEYHVVATFVYAPVPDSSGKIRKIAVWVLENTGQVNEREKARAAKLAIQQERDRLHKFFMQAPAGICILQGPEFRYELINPLYQELFPGRELLGKPLMEALPELKDSPLWGILRDVLSTGRPYEGNELLVPLARTPDGPVEKRYFNFIYQARLDEHCVPEGVIVFGIEITAMIKVQADLRKAREEADQQKRIYETITSGTPDLMYVWDLNYKFTYVNKALLAMWGKTWENAVGKGLRENGYEEWHAAMHEQEIDQVIATKASVRGEVSFPHAVLGKRIYDYILIPVFNEAGDVEAVAGTTRLKRLRNCRL
jgi:PAS domain S-box-containing protein